MFVTDVSGDVPVTCHVPLTYRGAPLEGAAPAFSGTDLAAEPGLTVRIARELQPADDETLAPFPSCGHVTAGWHAPDGTGCRGAVLTVFR